MPLSLQGIQELAPDQASLTAATKLRSPAKWPMVARDTEGGVIWGECKGSGSTPYRVVVTPEDAGYNCSCPSRKFPCKHALAIMWRYVDNADAFREAGRPDWVEAWLGRRRGPRKPVDTKRAAGPKSILRAELDAKAPAKVLDPEEEEKRAERARRAAERRRAAREASVAAGLDELDQWLADELAEGLGTFSGRMTERCRLAGARLVDARASGLAAVVDDIPRRLFAVPEGARAAKAGELLGQVALLVRAYRRQERLPAPLREDVRRRIGWAQGKEDLLQDPTQLRVKAHWRAVGVRSEAQADDLTRHETWLRRTVSKGSPDGPEWALLMDFVPRAAGRGGAPYQAGEVLDLELVFYPSAHPLRALVAEADRPPESPAPSLGLEGGAESLAGAWRAVRRIWAVQPWRDPIPFSASGVRVGALAGRFYLADKDHMLPLEADDRTHMEALASAGEVTAFGLASGLGHVLLAASTPLGPWFAT